MHKSLIILISPAFSHDKTKDTIFTLPRAVRQVRTLAAERGGDLLMIR
jgi:hypothetical protein